MKLHDQALPMEQQKVLFELGEALEPFGFYLGGGTAVAIHLGHRESLDLDWFTEARIDDSLKLAQEIQQRGIELQDVSVQRGTLHGVVSGVRVSFLEFGYPALQPTVPWPSYRCRIASLEDLATMKLHAVTQRGAKKDFLDVYAIGKERLSLKDMLKCYQERFSISDVSRVLYSLCFFEDADPDPMPKMLHSLAWDEVRATIRGWVKSFSGT
jgi:hypothetical protein